ncbi:MAG: BPSS1780 family membrane protein [Burkholderiales bacterium]
MATPARIVTAGRGPRWLGEGWRLFRAAPLSWIALVFAYWLLMNLLVLVPLAGIVVAPVLVPAFSVSFMAAGRAAACGGPLKLDVLFSGFREQRTRMLALGAVYLACLALLLGATILIDGGNLLHAMLGDPVTGAEVQPAFKVATMMVAMAIYGPVMMMFWYAPVLVAWHGVGVAKALFFSFLACLLNWRAFLAYGAVAILITAVAPSFALSALLLLTDGKLPGSLESFVYPLMLIMLPTLLASFYVSYRDVFGAPEAD